MPSLQLGIETTAIGMGIVFSVLILLSIITWLLATIVDGAVARKEAKKASKAAANAPAPVQVAAPVAAAPAATGLSAAKVAAIVAAVSAASGIPVSGLHFTAIRRLPTASTAWAANGTADIITNRQAYL